MVVTLTQKEFGEVCKELARRATPAGAHPDVIVGIARGGDYVAAEVAAAFGIDARHVVSIKLQRKGSGLKVGVIKGIIKSLPRWCADALRIVESRLYALKQRLVAPALRPVQTPPGFIEAVKDRKVLVVDDALDSGVTLASVVKAVKEAGARQVTTAVITTTRTNTIIKADTSYFPIGTIVRFPWAPDA